MLHWQDRGIIIQCTPFGESWRLVTMLTSQHGRYRGLCRARMPGLLVGNEADIMWTGRMEEHLGYFQWDQPYCHTVLLEGHQAALRCFELMCLLVQTLVPERVSAPLVYTKFIETVTHLPTPRGLKAFVSFEDILFQELGHDASDIEGTSLEKLHHHQILLEKQWAQATTLHRVHDHLIRFLEMVFKH